MRLGSTDHVTADNDEPGQVKELPQVRPDNIGGCVGGDGERTGASQLGDQLDGARQGGDDLVEVASHEFENLTSEDGRRRGMLEQLGQDMTDCVEIEAPEAIPVVWINLDAVLSKEF